MEEAVGCLLLIIALAVGMVLYVIGFVISWYVVMVLGWGLTPHSWVCIILGSFGTLICFTIAQLVLSVIVKLIEEL